MKSTSKNSGIPKKRKSVNEEIIARKEGVNGIRYKVKWHKPSSKKCSREPDKNLEYEDKISAGVPSIQGSRDRNPNKRVDDVCKEFGNWICKVEYSDGNTGWVRPDGIPDLYMLRSFFIKKRKINYVYTSFYLLN
uniref:Chromo domain-containing protein n=1 Tax=Strongyloides stercoralis TaxID=6248 RepID=A0AAF5DBN0_STRER